MEQRTAVVPFATAPTTLTRLLSLDVLRGLTMAGMVIVNNPGDWNTVYSPLLHAEWNGWTPTDLIFPFFLFIVGVSLTLSKSTMGSWGRIVRRAALIFLVGLLLAGIPRFPFQTWRIPGAGFLFLHTRYMNGGRSLLWMTSPDGKTWEEPHLLARVEMGHYQITAQEETRTFLSRAAFDPFPGSPEQMSELLKKDSARWKSYVELAKIKPL